MPSDSVTFAAAFGAIALALGGYLWHLERAGRRLEARLSTLEAKETAAKAKTGDADDGPKR